MKKIILALLAIGVIGAATFFVFQSKPAAKASSASVGMAQTDVTVVPASIASTSKLASSFPATVVQPLTPVARPSQAVASQPIAPDPRAELTTVIPELSRLIDAQDYENLMRDFMPPEELNVMLTNLGQPGQPMDLATLANRMRQDPAMTQKMAAASQFLAYLQTQTPVLDESGQIATYPMPKVVNGMGTINFVKEGGNWYVKNGRQFFR